MDSRPDFIAIDVETANASLDSICQVGLAAFTDGEVTAEVSTLVDPEDFFDPVNVSIHGITEETVTGAPRFAEVYQTVVDMADGAVLACHTSFDKAALTRTCAKHQLSLPACR